ncbi:SDR family NAD(P)-dependent oxidoreductase [Bosea sp. NBC_00550]|uniref:SDR family NAD(P)-dependent oxidoreductase n=1 Tax=Bosea sp. NBC_00550 TaxID=2969621 RepID=UPI0022312708|nr:SDR family oxidoreductase [Bosea sp. NBC_00550]UZF94948.1 SDR family oxidoreductase [Bosea sp. NBC_00550]
MTTGEFRNKLVVVTGAAGIYGRELARHFAALGARLALTDLRMTEAGSADTPLAELFDCDLTDMGQIQQFRDDVGVRMGTPEIVVANAGIYPFGGLFDTKPEVFDRVFDVNVRANFFLARYFGEAMISERREGCFVFIGSAAAHILRTNGLAYCASKRALEWMMKGIALELSPHGIRVNMVEPGLALGGADGPMPAGYAEAITSQLPLGRLIREGEMAKAVAFLASSAASFTTGATLSVDGGGAIPRRMKLS